MKKKTRKRKSSPGGKKKIISKKTKNSHWRAPIIVGEFILGFILILAGLAVVFSQEFNMNSSYKKISLSQLKTQLINTPLPSGTNSNSYHAPNNHGQYGLQSCHMIGESSNEYIIDFHNLGLINDLTTAGYQRPWFRPQWTFNVGGNIPAGKYRVGLEAFDGYATRNQTQGQNHERYRVLFKQNGHVVATSGYTSDVPDNIKAAKVVMTVNNELNIPDFNQVTIEHYAVAHGNTGSADSVRAICMQLIPIPQPINGQCGSAALVQMLYNSKPTDNLCAKGTATTITETATASGRTWTWKCQGQNGGADSNTCTAQGRPLAPPTCTTSWDPSTAYQGGTAALKINSSSNTVETKVLCTGDHYSENGTQDHAVNGSWNKTMAHYGTTTCTITVKSSDGQTGTCNNEIQVAGCGDGHKDDGHETCDNGDQNGVVPTVTYGQTQTYCKSDCTQGTVVGGECGDNHIQGDEQCDDGNTTSGDGCSSTCQNESNGIDLVKSVSKSTVEKGEIVTYTYKVKNTGDINLSNVKVVDDKLGTISCPKNTLQSQETMTCTKTAKITQGVINTATVEGTDSKDQKVTDSDKATVNVKNAPVVIPEPEDKPKKESCNSSIGNYIWYDTNGNGIQEDIEEGIEGIKVCAFRGNKKYCDTTDKHGRYKIKDLCAGNYDVRIKGVGGMVQTYDPDGQKDNRTKVKLKDKDDHTKADFGYKGGAPKTGVATNIALLIGLSTLITIGILIVMRRKGAL